MAKKRSTFDACKFVVECNRLLALDTLTAEFRQGVICTLTHVLHATGNYKGFNYLGWIQEGGYDRWVKDGSPSDTTPYLGDKTRVFFYLPDRKSTQTRDKREFPQSL